MAKPLTGRGVLVWLLGFFGLIIATNAYFITVSVKTFRGEDEQRPYLQGVGYNQTLARRAEQRDIGWRASLAASRLASGTVRITLDLARADGAAETGAVLTGTLRHPADENRDRVFALRQSRPGVYLADLADVSPGEWDIAVGNMGGAPFEATRRLWIP
jgi:nitrogen fixation protein FixH